MSSNMTIPVIIINWKGLQDTIECVHSMLISSHTNFHIFLIDNFSNDGSIETLLNLFGNHPKITLIANSSNLGFTPANNQVIHQLLNENYPYIALLNNDTAVDPDWLHHLLQCAQETNADMVSSKMIYYFDRSLMDNAGHTMLNTGEILPIGHKKPIQNFSSRFTNLGPCAGAALYKSSMLQEIGTFDPHFSTGYEDAELGLRGIVAGYRSVFEPNAIVYHKIGQSLNKVRTPEYLADIQAHILYSYFKLMPTGFLLLNLPLFILRYLMIFAFDLLLFRKFYLRLHTLAWKKMFSGRFKKALKERAQFFKNRKTISSLKMISLVQFSLWTDLERVKNVINP